MKKTLFVMIVSALVMPFIASANEATNQEYLELCQTYAKEDGIEPEGLDQFLKDCIKDLQESEKSNKD